MPGQDKHKVRKRIAGAYVSSVISISMVLLLVGIASLLIVNSGNVADYFRENMKISVLMKSDVDEAQAETFCDDLLKKDFVLSAEVISRERGREEMNNLLGADFLEVFETSPIPVSVELSLLSSYVSRDSLALVQKRLEAYAPVEEVTFQYSLVEALNENMKRISAVMAVFIGLMLFISFVLINNTVRLSVYDRRFAVHTMKLVGATRSFIRRPFMLRAFFQGVVSAEFASILLLGLLFLLKNSFGQLFGIITLESLLLVLAIVLAGGVLICMLSTFVVVGKLISLRKDELYF